jgi:sec-independent protein translocase protein TatA
LAGWFADASSVTRAGSGLLFTRRAVTFNGHRKLENQDMNVPFAVWDLGMGQIILILLVVLLMFGAKKLPELAKGLGQGIKEFKKASRDMQNEISTAASEETPPPPKREEPPKTAANSDPDKPQGPAS